MDFVDGIPFRYTFFQFRFAVYPNLLFVLLSSNTIGGETDLCFFMLLLLLFVSFVADMFANSYRFDPFLLDGILIIQFVQTIVSFLFIFSLKHFLGILIINACPSCKSQSGLAPLEKEGFSCSVVMAASYNGGGADSKARNAVVKSEPADDPGLPYGDKFGEEHGGDSTECSSSFGDSGFASDDDTESDAGIMEVESRLYSRVSVDDTPAASHLMR
jgi:hypothetical protein